MVGSECLVDSGENTQSNICYDKPKELIKAEMTNRIITSVRKHQPISCYDLATIENMPRTTLFFILKGLEDAGAIFSKMKISKLNHSKRFYYTSREIQKEGDPENNAKPLSNINKLGDDNENN